MDPSSATDTGGVRTVCARDCYDSCGLLVTPGRKGKLIIKGDPIHPVNRGGICKKCAIAYNGSFQSDSERLTTPLRRVGPKGAGLFEPVDWDTALCDIAGRLQTIVRESGPHTVLNAHYTGTRGVLARDFPMRFFNRLGATEVTPDTICNIAGQLASQYLFGTGTTGFDPRTAGESRCIVVWGCNPAVTGPHTEQHWLRSSNATTVVVDPTVTETARRANLHIQLRPGSDAVLALGLVKAIGHLGLWDTGFIAEHVVGWNELLESISTLELPEVAAITGVPQEQILEFAKLYAGGPSLLWIGMGMTRQRWGGNAVRSILLLPVAAGQFGKPGCGFTFINGAAVHGVDLDDVLGSALRRGDAPQVSHMDLVQRLSDTAQSRSLFCWNINLAATNPRQVELGRALEREDLLTVVTDLFLTDTARLADYVLPAASFLEHDDLIYSYFHMTVGAQVQVRPAPGMALPNATIFRRLAKEMQFADHAFDETDDEILERLTAGAVRGMTFGELKNLGTVFAPVTVKPQFAGLKFPTASGKIEVLSTAAVQAGLPALPIVMHDGVQRGDELRLLTPASEWMSNSMFGNDAGIRRRYSGPHLRLSPRDAASRRLSHGDAVRVHSSEGEIVVPLLVDSCVLQGTAVMPKNGWIYASGSGNSNQLTTSQPSDMGRGSSVQSLTVRVEAAAPASGAGARLSAGQRAGELPTPAAGSP